ncbi:MAG: patatin-like phospholipase family protein [Candidatus Binatia bacterium]
MGGDRRSIRGAGRPRNHHGLRTRGVLVALAGLLAQGCTAYFAVNDPVPETNPMSGYRPRTRPQAGRSNELLLTLAFSGGGTRAAAFAYGVLEELAATLVAFDGSERALVDEVDVISGVSGGSFTAAYYGLHGRDTFDTFEKRFLRRDVQGDIGMRLLAPWNWPRLFSPWFTRSDLVAEYYDDRIFDRALFADLEQRNGPAIQIFATDMATGHPFAFNQDQFDFLCSDLLTYSIARAVTASSAVPGLFAPITLKNFSGGCGFEPPAWVRREAAREYSFDRMYVNARNLDSYLNSDRRKYIRLVDGGISDNLALRGPFEAWTLRPPRPGERPAQDGVLRNVVVIVVNAATTPEAAWETVDLPPALSIILRDSTSAQLQRYNLETLEQVRALLRLWDAVAREWEQPVRFHLVEVDFMKIRDAEERRYLNSQPTSFRIDDEGIDRLIAAGRQALRESPSFERVLGSIAGQGDEPQPAR